MEKVIIELDQKWVKRINSPLGKSSQILSGVSVSFAPLFLYLYGQGNHPLLGPSWVGVSICWRIILLSGLFHITLAQYIVQQVQNKKQPVS